MTLPLDNVLNCSRFRLSSEANFGPSSNLCEPSGRRPAVRGLLGSHRRPAHAGRVPIAPAIGRRKPPRIRPRTARHLDRQAAACPERSGSWPIRGRCSCTGHALGNR